MGLPTFRRLIRSTYSHFTVENNLFQLLTSSFSREKSTFWQVLTSGGKRKHIYKIQGKQADSSSDFPGFVQSFPLLFSQNQQGEGEIDFWSLLVNLNDYLFPCLKSVCNETISRPSPMGLWERVFFFFVGRSGLVSVTKIRGTLEGKKSRSRFPHISPLTRQMFTVL